MAHTLMSITKCGKRNLFSSRKHWIHCRRISYTEGLQYNFPASNDKRNGDEQLLTVKDQNKENNF